MPNRVGFVMVNTMFKKYLPIVSILVLAACGTRTPGMDLPDGYTVPLDRSSWVVTTKVFSDEVLAGEAVNVQCELLGVQDGVGASALELVARFSPNLEVESEENRIFSVTPTAVGEYLVFCATADGAVTDSVGDSFTVVPAEPVAVETQLETTSAIAGVPVAVDCQMFDAYGNETTIDVREFKIATDAILENHQGIGSHYVLHGTLAGTYPVQCELNSGVVDVTPEQLTVLPGIPAQSETVITADVVSPTEVVGVLYLFRFLRKPPRRYPIRRHGRSIHRGGRILRWFGHGRYGFQCDGYGAVLGALHDPRIHRWR